MEIIETFHRDRWIETDALGLPLKTKTGPRCGKCGARHENGPAVSLCYVVTRALDEEAAAEMAAERHYEDRGYWDALAQDEYEAEHGVIQFDEAYRMACPELFAGEEIDA